MIGFLERKVPDLKRVQSLLQESREENYWTNFGPVSRMLERVIHERLGLPPSRAVVATASGTSALHAIVSLHRHLRGRPLRWVVSSFSFHCQGQGPLSDARILDCAPDGFLDLEAVRRLRPDSFDGILVTNVFGRASDVDAWTRLARELDKVLIFDSASCFGSTSRGRPLGGSGDAEMFSFHQTKPCGVGEGGCVVLPAEHEDVFRSLINFGLYKAIDTGALSTNAKMSDVAAAFILDRIERVDGIRAHHREQFRRVAGLARKLGLTLLFDEGEETMLPALVPILYPRALDLEQIKNPIVKLQKYFRPLSAATPTAVDLYRRIVACPCHPDLAELEDSAITTVLEQMLRARDTVRAAAG